MPGALEILILDTPRTPDRKIPDYTLWGWPEGRRRGEKTSEKLARQIVDYIISNRLKPGAMLPPEAEMIEIYKVGRATLREALRLLEVQGLLSLKPGPRGGPLLALLTPADFARMAKLHFHMRGANYRQVLDARLAIEPLMARLAATAQNREGLQQLKAVVKAADEINLSDEEGWQTTADAFHAVVASISGNSVLDLLGASLKEIYHGRPRRAVTPPRMRAQIRATHKAIAEAILAGNGSLAEHLMRDHMSYVADRSHKVHGCGLDEQVRW